jgi:flagellar hook-associated protein 1 FlgK
MQALDIGLSALRTHQQELTTLGNNIANASTPGYHRQRAELVNRPGVVQGGHLVGAGVNVAVINRLRDTATEEALLRNESLIGLVGTELSVAENVERLLTPGDASVHARLSDFFNRLEALSNNPEEATVRGEFLNAAESLVEEFNLIDNELAGLDREIRDEAGLATKQINGLIDDIAGLNKQIYYERAVGRQPNDLLDRRDQLTTNLSQWLDVSLETQENGRDVVYISGGAIAITGTSKHVAVRSDGNGGLELSRESDRTTIPISSGKLRGLFEAANQTIPAVRQTFEAFTSELIQAVDQQHALGLPASGAYDILPGSRAVDSLTLPLNQAGGEFPITAGELSITVTDVATGVRSTQRISIDPTVDSITDVASRLDALSGIFAAVDPQANTLVIAGEGGSLIDFAGRPDNTPDLSSVSGTTQPEFSGTYTGSVNGQYAVTFSGAGDIGTTAGLTATVRNLAGDVVARLDVGAGYEAGVPLQIEAGVSLSFSPGTVAAADTFSILTTADGDTSNILSALGINSFFTGDAPGKYGIRKDLVSDPSLLAVSKTGRTGEAQNIAALAILRDIPSASLQDRTFVETLADLTAGAGLDVQHSQNQESQLIAFNERLQTDRDSVSGVDPNEELLRMLEVERAFQAAARFISVIDETITELLNMAR